MAGRVSLVGQLSGALHLHHGTLTPLLRRTEANGLLTRQRRADDERSVAVELTAAGTAMRSRTGQIQHAVHAAIGLNDQQTAALQSTLRAITVSAGENARADWGVGDIDPAHSGGLR